MNGRRLLLAAALVATAAHAEDASVRLYAAGSLRAVMADIAQAFAAENGVRVAGTYGASGLLRGRIEKGAPADVFASADVGNAMAVAATGRSGPPVVFTRNRLCALTAPGAFAALDRKALKLVGGPASPEPPRDRSVYGLLIAERKADIFLTYCTNAVAAAREVPGARLVTIPEPLALGASYGSIVMNDAPPAAARFALFVLSIRGQQLLEQHGFTPVATP